MTTNMTDTPKNGPTPRNNPPGTRIAAARAEMDQNQSSADTSDALKEVSSRGNSAGAAAHEMENLDSRINGKPPQQ